MIDDWLIFIIVIAMTTAFLSMAYSSPSDYPESYDKPLVIMYWATYCSYCKNAIPILNELADSNEAYVRGVALDSESKPEQVQAIIRKYKPTFPLDSKYVPPATIYGVPNIFIIKMGDVTKVWHRSTEPGEIERYL